MSGSEILRIRVVCVPFGPRLGRYSQSVFRLIGFKGVLSGVFFGGRLQLDLPVSRIGVCD